MNTDRDQDPLVNVVPAIEELAARWHSHRSDGSFDGDFDDGLCAGWAQAIALLLGVKYREVVKALHADEL